VNLQKATFKVFDKSGASTSLDVQYNPDSLTFDKKPKHASITIPGLDAPLKQFVRNEAETVTVELFFDSTEQGTGAGAKSVTELTDPFVGLVKIDPATHAPPICSFAWGAKFPGDSLPERYKNQRRTEFKGVVTDVKQEYKLFSPEGTPLRAVLTLTLDEYRPLHQQLKELNLMSADHTRSHVLERGDTLALVAWLQLDDAASWRVIADANHLDDPRRLEPGRTLLVPPVTSGLT
jgi:nucleoid-associated protein YgaU